MTVKAPIASAPFFDGVIVGAGNIGLSFLLALAKQWQLQRIKPLRKAPHFLVLERNPNFSLYRSSQHQQVQQQSSSSSSSPKPKPKPSYSNRVSALTPNSIKFLQSLGAWARIERTGRFQPFDRMQAHEAGSDALAVIVENDVLQASMAECLVEDSEEIAINQFQSISDLFSTNDKDNEKDKDKIKFSILTGSEASAIQFERFQSNLIAGKSKDGAASFFCPLVIGSDGGGDNSPARKLASIDCIKIDYDQVGVVATLSHEEQSSPTAFQRFLSTGPIAILPLNGSTVSSMVWTLPSNVGRKLRKLTTTDHCGLLERLVYSALWHHQSDVSYYLHRILTESGEKPLVDVERHWDQAKTINDERGISSLPQIHPPSSIQISPDSVQTFPLQFRHCTEYDKDRVVLIGDAAHSIHPLAGQGLNLGLGDAETLATVLVHYYNLNQDIGQPFILAEYSKRQMIPNLSMQAVCHALQGFYDHGRPAAEDEESSLGMAVRLKQEISAHTMRLINASPTIKSLIINYAMKSNIRNNM